MRLYVLYCRHGRIFRKEPPDRACVGVGEQVFLVGAGGFAAPIKCRVLAQAMNLASFEDVRRLERALGSYQLAEAMVGAEPGWISDRSWEFWRGRLVLATGRAIPEEPPRRSFNARMF